MKTLKVEAKELEILPEGDYIVGVKGINGNVEFEVLEGSQEGRIVLSPNRFQVRVQHQNIYDSVAEVTGVDRETVKKVAYALAWSYRNG